MPRLQLFDLALQVRADRQAGQGADPGDREAGRAVRPVLPGPVPGLAGARRRRRRGEGEAAGRGPRPADRPEGRAARTGPGPAGPGPARASRSWTSRGLDEAQKREKLESAINSYRRAIELGLRDPVIVRHVVELLFQAGRGSEALEVYSQIPALVPAHRRPGAEGLADRPGQSRLPPGRGDRAQGASRPTPRISRPGCGWPRCCWRTAARMTPRPRSARGSTSPRPIPIAGSPWSGSRC